MPKEHSRSGFEHYAKFLLRWTKSAEQRELFEDFAGLPVRKVIRPTQFYCMLLQRLKDHRTMDDGVAWAAQIDFIARFADWDRDSDPFWLLQRVERSALVALNVPHLVSQSDRHEISDGAGISIHTDAISGIDRARERVQKFDQREMAWHIEVITQNTSSISKSAGREGGDVRELLRAGVSEPPPWKTFIAEAENIAGELSSHATRRRSGAAWIGMDWRRDSEVAQLTPLGLDLYNGVSGIAVFLAAVAAVTGRQAAGELALAAISGLRKNLKSRNSGRMARSLGIGGATGLGSIVYALSLMSKSLHNDELLSDAHVAAELFTDDLIPADKKLDVIGGSAGGILGLLRLFRDTQSGDVLDRATKCGEHILGQRCIGPNGRGTWRSQGPHLLTGMSHGAAGLAFSLASLSAATGREEFSRFASEYIAFENSTYDPERNNWPDLRRSPETGWPCNWCHGAPGIGLARIATIKWVGLDSEPLTRDIQNALYGTERGRPSPVDTLCCGTLGSVEFLYEAGVISGGLIFVILRRGG